MASSGHKLSPKNELKPKEISVEELRAADLLRYIDEAEKYILDLIDILILKASHKSSIHGEEISILLKGFKERGVALDFTGKLSIFGFSKNYLMQQSSNEHLQTFSGGLIESQFIQQTSDTTKQPFYPSISQLDPNHQPDQAISNCTPSDSRPKSGIEISFFTPPDVHLNSNLTSANIFKNDLQNELNQSIINTVVDDHHKENIDLNSSLDFLQINQKTPSNDKGFFQEICSWANSSPMVLPVSRNNTINCKAEGKEKITLLNDISLIFSQEQPNSNQILLEGFNEQTGKVKQTKRKLKQHDANYHSKIKDVKTISIRANEENKEKEKLYVNISEATKVINDTSLKLKTTSLISGSDIKEFYMRKLNIIDDVIASIKLSSQSSSIDCQWELLQMKIKAELIKAELNQFTRRFNHKAGGYQNLYLFMFEYPMFKPGATYNKLKIKKIYDSLILENKVYDKEIDSWITKRACLLSKLKVKSAIKPNGFHDNIYYFGKYDYLQAFFDHVSVVTAFNESLRELLNGDNNNASHVMSVQDLNNGYRFTLSKQQIKNELNHQLQIIYRKQTRSATKGDSSIKVASLNVITDTFYNLF